jgi:uncharacterized membrane protein
MSAERHAMEAALNYAKQLEHELKAMGGEIQEQRTRNNELRRQLNDVKDAVSDRDKPSSRPPAGCYAEDGANEVSAPQYEKAVFT